MNRPMLKARQHDQLQQQLKSTQDAHLYRRTLAVLEFSKGRSITDIAQTLGVSRQSVYNWIEQYTQDCSPAALHDAPRCGRPSRWDDEARALLAALLAHTPPQFGYPAANWTVPLLRDQLQQRLGQSFADDTVRRELRRQCYVWKRPRYVLDPDPQREKKTANPQEGAGIAATQRAAG
jgi:transposase